MINWERGTKICGHCKREKYLHDFYQITSRKDGTKYYDHSCKECRKMLNSAAVVAERKKRTAAERAIRENLKENEGYCKRCKRVLPREEFSTIKATGKANLYCKECCREKSRLYPKKSKARNGVYRRNKDGRMYVYDAKKKGKGVKLFWNENMLSALKRYYPNTSNADVASMLGVCESTALKKAKELGLKKSPEYISTCKKRASERGCMVIVKRFRELKQQKQQYEASK